LTRCYRLLGQYEEGYTLAKRSLEEASAHGSILLKIGTLRCIAEFGTDQGQQAAYLREALALAQGRRLFDEAACRLSLASLSGDQQQWQMGERLLYEIGAHHWLRGRSIQHAPMIPVVI
jgi:hypothetical protein